MNTHRLNPLSVAVLAASCCLPIDANAADEADTAAPHVEEVIVSGENIRRRLLDTNTSINVQTAAEIRIGKTNPIPRITLQYSAAARAGLRH
jgi:outer membrane receptor for ferrienterochelin and colicin